MPNLHSKTQIGAARAAIALIYRLAALMRASFIYPVNNQRVIEARNEFLSHSNLWIEGGVPLRIELLDGDLIMGGEPVTAPPQLARWIAKCFEKAFITGVEIAVDIDADSIVEFASTLRRCEEQKFQRGNPLWVGDYFGLMPILDHGVKPTSDAPAPKQTPNPDDIPGPSRKVAEMPAAITSITLQEPAHLDPKLGELAEEIDKLPHSAMQSLAADDTRQGAELFGVYLHRYHQELNTQTAERLGKRILTMLGAPSYGMLKNLEPYLDASTGSESEHNIAEFLQHHGRADLLRKNEYLRPDAVAFSFPDHFTLFLDSLSADQPHDIEALRDVCLTINQDRIAKARDALIDQDGILTPSRVDLITAVATHEALALVSLIAEHGPLWARAPVAQFLRKQDLPEAEAAALRAINPPSLLPANYLYDLCQLHSTFNGNAKLREFSGFLVRKFIEDSEHHPEQSERRIYAIRSLRNLPSLESIKLLVKLSGPIRLLSLNRNARMARKAAQETLTEMVGD